jgi:oligosaccharyltransferase complex subunit gamma
MFKSILLVTCLIAYVNCYEKDDLLAEKVEQLTEWSLKKPVIRLNFDKFKHFVKSAPRNYSIVVMLTALSTQRECQICKPANEEYQIVAQSWRYSGQFTNSLFFAMVDFDDAPDVFKMLNTASAPQFIIFGRKTNKPKSADHFDMSRVGFSAEQIAKWIGDRSDTNIKIFRPPNYSGFLLLVLVVLMVGSVLYVKRNDLGFLYNKTTWSLIIIGSILMFISGQMWNQIRGPPLVHRNPQTGQIRLIADGNQRQYVAETYIIYAIYGSIVAGVILMNEAPKYLNDGAKNKVLAFGGIGMVLVFFSMILSIFKSKYQGYPYSLLF